MISPSPAILLIEDSEADRVLINSMLADHSAQAWPVETRGLLGAGLELLASADSASRFAAVLLDLNLPDSHGLETFTKVRQACAWLPVVVLTGNDDEQAALAAVQAGAQDYLFKNALSGDLLHKSLRYAVERKRVEREWRFELEQRVRERTAELSAANEVLQREIAERRRVEEALQDSRRFVERISNATPSIVYILEIPSRRVLYANEQWTVVLGYAATDVRDFEDATLQRIVHPDDLERVQSSFREAALLRDDEIHEVEARFLHADGNWRWLHFRKIVFRRADDGAVRMLLGSANDVTERKLAEEQSRHQQEQLVYVSRLTMLGELASGLAHELNQPLMAVANYSQACLRRVRNGDWPREELISTLEKNAQQALLAGEIIKRLRRLVSRRPPDQSATDINETIREVLEMVRSEAEGRDVHLKVRLVDALPIVPADRVQLQQVMLNLIRNGFEAMQGTPPEDRCLTVESSPVDHNGVSVSISDQGSGCDARQLDRLFEPFFSTKEHGLGMGLSISRSIIEAHGGRLTAQPNVTRGLTFCFTLPVHPGVAG